MLQYVTVCDSPSVHLFRADRTGVSSSAIVCFKPFSVAGTVTVSTPPYRYHVLSRARNTQVLDHALLTVNAETFQRLRDIQEEAQKEYKFARSVSGKFNHIAVDEWHRDTDNVSSDKGADQPAEEVEATSVGSTRESDGLSEDASDLAQLLADDSQEWWVEEPAAYKTQSESDVGSRKRAHRHTESDENSECSGSIASKVARLALTVPSVPPSTPAAAPQAATAEAAPDDVKAACNPWVNRMKKQWQLANVSYRS